LDRKGIRKLTPKECFNFQGFPVNYKLPDIADAPLYKQAGNSVTVKVIKKIAKNIYCAYLHGNLVTQLQNQMKRVECIKMIAGCKYLMQCYTYNNRDYATPLKKYHENFININKSVNYIGGRNANISEAFTEGIVCYMTNVFRIHKIKPIKTKNNHSSEKISSSIDCYDFNDNKTVQIKASTLKTDCSSFGPDSKFDKLIFLDFYKCEDFNIYQFDSTLLDDIIMCKEKNETFKDQQQSGKRPRFSIKKEIIDKNKMKPIFTGNIHKLESYYKILAKAKEDYIDLTQPVVNIADSLSSDEPEKTSNKKVIKKNNNPDEPEKTSNRKVIKKNNTSDEPEKTSNKKVIKKNKSNE